MRWELHTNRLRVAGFAAVAMLGSATIAQSANLITNGSFEDGTNAPGAGFRTLNATNTDITGWTVASGSIDWIGSYWQASAGQRSIDLSGNEPGALDVSQTLSLGPGKYELSFDLSGNPDGGPTTKSASVILGGVPGSPFTKNYTLTAANTLANMNYIRQSIVFTLSNLANVTVGFANPLAGPYGPAIDNVSLSAVPLPAAAWLFGSAFLGLCWLGRRSGTRGVSMLPS
jgi:choice-of-anchor C domain-containing protein